MSKEKAFPSHLAQAVARKLVAELTHACDRIEIVGSLRRRKAFVHDIDIVLVPRGDSGGSSVDSLALLNRALDSLTARGSLTSTRSGDKIKSFVASKTGIPVDIYVATEDTWATLLLIRTGSKEHNVKLAQRARKLGFKLRASGDGVENSAGDILKIGTEEELFSLLELAYLPPEQRD